MVINMTLQRGTPVYAAGKFLNGMTGGVLGTTTAFTGTTGTFEAWVKSTATSLRVAAGNNSAGYWFGHDANGRGFFGHPTGTLAATALPVINDGNWHHLALTLNGSAVSTYVDGAVGPTFAKTGTFTMGNGTTAIGGQGATATYDWTGSVDEVRISNTVRYTGAFTVPTVSFVGDANTLGLYHLEADGTDNTPDAAQVGDVTAPTVPTGLTVTPGNTQNIVNWTASTDAVGVTGYRVYRGGTLVGSPTTTSYTDTGLTNGTSYSYTVAAIDGAGNLSAQSSAVSGTPAAVVSVPGAPTGLAATVGNTQVGLSWTAPASNGGAAITDYLVEYQPSGGSWTTFADGTSTATTATVTGLTNGTAYLFRVSAINSAGTSSASSTASATPSAVNVLITPDDPNIVYSPYNWLVTSGVATTNNPGAYLRTTIQGSPTSIVANFDMSTPPGTAMQLVITVDGQVTTVTPMAATVTIAIPSQAGTPWAKQIVEILVQSANGNNNRWNVPLAAAVKFTGFTVAPGTATTATTRRAPYNILAFGDSLLEGVSTNPGGVQDSRSGWGAPLRALLGAEIGVVGYSGSGLNGTAPGNVPNWTSIWNQLWNGQARSFTSPAEPNIVLIHLGTNGMTQANATTVLNGVLAATTATKILVIQQWNGTTNKATWQAAIAATTAPSRITYLDTTGWVDLSNSNDSVHPWGYVNLVDVSPRIAAAVQPLLTGTATFTPKRFVNAGGTAKPIG